MDVDVNLTAVLLATIAGMTVGMIWYNEKVLGGKWLALAKINPKKGSMSWSMGSAVVSSFVMAYVLAHVSFLSNQFYQNSFMYDSVMTAFWLWLGFQGLRMFMHDQFNQRRKKESLIHMGNDLVTLVVMALVIGAVGL